MEYIYLATLGIICFAIRIYFIVDALCKWKDRDYEN